MSNGEHGAARSKQRIVAKHCLDCHYVLDGLATPRCPECGRAFDLNDPETYTTKPPLVRWKLWFPGVATGLIGGLLIVIFIEMFWGARAYGLWFGVPFAVAAIAGYRLKYASHWLLGAVLFISFIGLLSGFAIIGLAGPFCMLVLLVMFGGPIIVGGLIGIALRVYLKRSRFSQAEHLPVIALLALPVLISMLEGGAQPGPIEVVTTRSIIHAPIERAWDAMMFYEEVTHNPPLILRIGLARPTHTRGSSRTVGDVKTCLYNKGRISKEITHVESLARLEFRIIEQSIGYEKDVLLRGGRFEFEAIDEERTRITLVTEYQPLLVPRFAWRPSERFAIGTLHEYVIEGMRREAKSISDQYELAEGSTSP